MKTKRIVIAALLAVFMSTTAFANGANPVEKREGSSNEVQKESGGTIKYYGEKAGLFRPCKGHCALVCKEITTNTEKGTATVSDGENTIIVEIDKVNFEDGSIRM
ncbi:MAG: hypothetical protein IJ057_05530 [Bacteroidales bacterium]|nr:hypothetical protein [Bacteroidales bacterium]